MELLATSCNTSILLWAEELTQRVIKCWESCRPLLALRPGIKGTRGREMSESPRINTSWAPWWDGRQFRPICTLLAGVQNLKPVIQVRFITPPTHVCKISSHLSHIFRLSWQPITLRSALLRSPLHVPRLSQIRGLLHSLTQILKWLQPRVQKMSIEIVNKLLKNLYTILFCSQNFLP